MVQLTLYDVLRIFRLIPAMGYTTIIVLQNGYRRKILAYCEDLQAFESYEPLKQYYMRDVSTINLTKESNENQLEIWVY